MRFALAVIVSLAFCLPCLADAKQKNPVQQVTPVQNAKSPIQAKKAVQKPTQKDCKQKRTRKLLRRRCRC